MKNRQCRMVTNTGGLSCGRKAAGSNFSNEKRQKMAICSPVCSPVRPCSPVLDCLNSNMPRPNQRPPSGQPLQGRSTPSTSPAQAARQPRVAHSLATSAGQCIELDRAHTPGWIRRKAWPRAGHQLNTAAPRQQAAAQPWPATPTAQHTQHQPGPALARCCSLLGANNTTPLGRVAQQSEGAARITRRATLWGEPTKGGGLPSVSKRHPAHL